MFKAQVNLLSWFSYDFSNKYFSPLSQQTILSYLINKSLFSKEETNNLPCHLLSKNNFCYMNRVRTRREKHEKSWNSVQFHFSGSHEI